MTRADQAADVLNALHEFQEGDEVRFRATIADRVQHGKMVHGWHTGRVECIYRHLIVGELVFSIVTEDGTGFMRVPHEVELV